MNEVKTPKKPLIFYYGIAMVVLLLLNMLVMPLLHSTRWRKWTMARSSR